MTLTLPCILSKNTLLLKKRSICLSLDFGAKARYRQQRGKKESKEALQYCLIHFDDNEGNHGDDNYVVVVFVDVDYDDYGGED